MNTHRNPRKGQAAIMMTLSLIPMLGLMGLVVDVGWAYWRKEAARTAAQSAAYSAMKFINPSSLGACNTNGFACQTATPCSASPSYPPSTAMDAGCLYAKQNGFVNNGNQSVTMEAHGPDGVHSAAMSGTTLPLYWISFTATEHAPQLFSAVLGQRWNTISARATAALFSSPSGACIYALSTTGTGLTIGGNNTINSACGIYVDSSDASNAMVGGGSSVVTASSIKVVGGFNPNGGASVTPYPTTFADYTPDPLGWIYPPAVPNRCDSTGLTQDSGSISMPSDGYYVVCGGGFSMTANKTVTMAPGIYIFKGGAVNLRNGHLSGSGVMWYFTNSVSSVYTNGNIDINLSAPTTGPYEGILFFGNRAESIASVTINGGSSQILNGALYFPTSDISYSGGSSTASTHTALIAKTITFLGDSYFTADPSGNYTGIGLPRIGFVE
jgi:hypothetical protein